MSRISIERNETDIKSGGNCGLLSWYSHSYEYFFPAFCNASETAYRSESSGKENALKYIMIRGRKSTTICQFMHAYSFVKVITDSRSLEI